VSIESDYVIGEEKSVADILAEISKDLPFYSKSGGGVTLSGVNLLPNRRYYRIAAAAQTVRNSCGGGNLSACALETDRKTSSIYRSVSGRPETY
jgi:hypothetical protein